MVIFSPLILLAKLFIGQILVFKNIIPGIAGVTTNRVLCTITTAITTRPKRRPCEIGNFAFASHELFPLLARGNRTLLFL
jgi:hypothetical protein